MTWKMSNYANDQLAEILVACNSIYFDEAIGYGNCVTDRTLGPCTCTDRGQETMYPIEDEFIIHLTSR